MRSEIAILCPGESLKRFLAEDTKRILHRAYIGVNRAATGYPVDWWVMGDFWAYRMYARGVWSGAVGVSQHYLPTRGEEGPRRPWFPMGNLKYLPDVLPPTTFCHALLFAANLWVCLKDSTQGKKPGMRRKVGHETMGPVYVYGSDWQGDKYWDGEAPLERHRPSNWESRWHKDAIRFPLFWSWLRGHEHLGSVDWVGIPLERIEEIGGVSLDP